MSVQIVMDVTGDSRHQFDAADPISLAQAERRFQELLRAGFTAAIRSGDGRAELIRNLDAGAEETLFFPRLQGG
jgi:hypothetical protein